MQQGIEQAAAIGPERILNWMDRPSLTRARATHATGASRRMLNYYLSGAKPLPKTVWLACLGWETVGAAGGDAVSQLQGQCLRVVAKLTGLRQLPMPGAVLESQPRGRP